MTVSAPPRKMGKWRFCSAFLVRAPTSVLSVCCPKAACPRQIGQQLMPICSAITKAGATGLEPATSGVTGHFQDRYMGENGLRIAHFMLCFSTSALDGAAWLSQALSDVCCPFAARRAARPASVAGSQLGEGSLRREDSDAVVLAEREEVLAVAGGEHVDAGLDCACEDRVVGRVAGDRLG